MFSPIAEMDAKQKIDFTIETDEYGRKLEAFTYYQEIIPELMDKMFQQPKNELKKYMQSLQAYIDRAEQLRVLLNSIYSPGKILYTININENETGKGFKELFEPFLKSNVREIKIEEPLLNKMEHYKNLEKFLDVLAKNCHNLEFVLLESNINKLETNAQLAVLNKINEDLDENGVRLYMRRIQNLNKSQVSFNNGIIVKLSNGLHFHKVSNAKSAKERNNYNFRKCKATDIEIWRSSRYN